MSENIYLENSTVVDKNLFYRYTFLNSTLSSKKGTMLLMMGIIVVFIFITFFKYIINPTIDIYFIISLVSAILALIGALSHLFFLHRYTLVASRITMLLTFLVLGIELRTDTMLLGLLIACSVAIIASIPLTTYLNNKSFKKYSNFSYDYVFKPNIMNIKIIINDNINEASKPYKFYKVYKFDNYYFAYYSKSQAIIIDAKNFIHGTEDNFESYLALYDIKVKHLNWKYHAK